MLHSRSVSDAHLFPRTLDGPLARALHPPGEARQLSHIRCFSQLGHMPRTSHVPFLTAGLSHSHTVSDPHTRWQGFPRRHTRAASLAARSRSPRTSSRRHSPPQTYTHTEPPAVPGCSPGTSPSAHARPPPPSPAHTHTGPPLLTAAGTGPSASPGRPPVCACGKPEDLPCGLFGSTPPPPPGQLRGPGPEQLVFVPTRRPGGRGEEGSAGPAPRSPGHRSPQCPPPRTARDSGAASTCRRASPDRGNPHSFPNFAATLCTPVPHSPSQADAWAAARPPGGWPRRRQRRALGGCGVRAAIASRRKANGARGAGRGSH